MNAQMGLNQTTELLHIKENHQQNKKQIYGAEDIFANHVLIKRIFSVYKEPITQ